MSALGHERARVVVTLAPIDLSEADALQGPRSSTGGDRGVGCNPVVHDALEDAYGSIPLSRTAL